MSFKFINTQCIVIMITHWIRPHSVLLPYIVGLYFWETTVWTKSTWGAEYWPYSDRVDCSIPETAEWWPSKIQRLTLYNTWLTYAPPTGTFPLPFGAWWPWQRPHNQNHSTPEEQNRLSLICSELKHVVNQVLFSFHTISFYNDILISWSYNTGSSQIFQQVKHLKSVE